VRLFGSIEELIPRAPREGPLVLVEEYVVRTNLVHDLIVTGTPEAHRAVLNIARFMRFAADHQTSRPRDSLVDFIAYVDLYQEVGGDLEIETPVSAGVSGVQLMTIYQAKGLEYPAVVVPRVVEGQFPDTRGERLLLPVELLKQTPPAQFAEEEERRLLFVAMTRARDRLLVTTIDQPGLRTRPSRFVAEVAPQLDGDRSGQGAAGEPTDVVVLERTERPEPEIWAVPGVDDDAARVTNGGDDDGSLWGWATVGEADTQDDGTAALERLMPVPTAFERRYALRRRAVELIGVLEQLDPADESARAAVIEELMTVATDAAGAAEEERRQGIDPLTMRVIARHAPAGQSLLQIAPLPSAFSHSQFRLYQECGLRYAFERVYRIPSAETKGFFEFGSLVHATFEAFVKQRREARAAGEPEPTFEDLKAAFDQRWTPDAYTDATEASHYQRRSGHLLERFYERELASLSEAIGIEKDFTLELDAPDDGAPIKIRGQLDRIDRHPDGSIEVLDYKTGSAKSQSWVDQDEQLTTYALALAKGAVIEESTGQPIPAASKLTLYFTESDQAISTTRTPEQLAEHEAHLVELAMRIRGGDFTAVPDYRRCGWCDFRRICPSRYKTPEG
jgi:RecB family exonuclease